MGLGVVLLSPDGARREQSGLAPGHGCNNEAELHALCLALDLALAAGHAPAVPAGTLVEFLPQAYAKLGKA